MKRLTGVAVGVAFAICLSGTAAFAQEAETASITALSCAGTSSAPTAASGIVRAGATVGCNQTVSSITVEARLFGPNGTFYVGHRTCTNVRVCSVSVAGTFARGDWFSMGKGSARAYDGTGWSGEWAGSAVKF